MDSRAFDGNDMLPEPFEKAKQAYESLFEGDHIDEAKVSETAELIYEIVQSAKERLSESRTARLWFQYLDLLQILGKNLRAERSGNLELYLQSLLEMLPYFAASGHNLYTKPTWMFVQSMFQLRKDNPEQYRKLQEYLFSRRTDNYWAALSHHLVIE